jgi:hypothetical protein
MIFAVRIGVETVTEAPSIVATRGWENATTSSHDAIWVKLDIGPIDPSARERVHRVAGFGDGLGRIFRGQSEFGTDGAEVDRRRDGPLMESETDRPILILRTTRRV